MKKMVVPMLILAAVTLFAGPAMAIDLEALDKVHVLMTKSQVKALLGEPHHNSELMPGLNSEVYDVEGIEHLEGAGCIYNGDILVGTAFIFGGESADIALERMKAHGFVQQPAEDGVIRLTGKDDNTGAPIAVTILEEGGWTTVISVEKMYYEKTVKEKGQ